MIKPTPVELYLKAVDICVAEGYEWEMEMVRKKNFSRVTPDDFFREFVWVVVNSGMKNQVAERIFVSFMSDRNPSKIKHPAKRMAIEEALAEHPRWFEELKESDDKLAYLNSRPHIGPITKFHLARNIGLDVAKPDRHLARIAMDMGAKDAQDLCEQISREVGERVGVVDVVLWRAANLVPGFPSRGSDA